MDLQDKIVLREQLEKQYLEKFGSASLDRCVCYEYGPPSNSDRGIDDLISDLKNAIETDTRLEQYPEELFEQIIW
ncbi:hypothetical protein KG090_02625 [Carnobacteriaceae bacterium zg-ZUI240]|nr:hypothetical protein [Carnobacteriaceae bacterium zg-ZUI240]